MTIENPDDSIPKIDVDLMKDRLRSALITWLGVLDDDAISVSVACIGPILEHEILSRQVGSERCTGHVWCININTGCSHQVIVRTWNHGRFTVCGDSKYTKAVSNAVYDLLGNGESKWVRCTRQPGVIE
jgi:hypothetical protein